VLQVPLGGRVQLADGSILILNADSAVNGAVSGSFPALSDVGVTFAFVDRSVRSSFTYFYAVTAFDVNSLASGPSSIESARVTKSTTHLALADIHESEVSHGIVKEYGASLPLRLLKKA
jgi:hypothetical protein